MLWNRVSRLVAAVIEQNHDEKGCIWTKSTTPFMVDIIVSNSKMKMKKIWVKKSWRVKASNVEVILDDRINARFGFKIEILSFRFSIW